MKGACRIIDLSSEMLLIGCCLNKEKWKRRCLSELSNDSEKLLNLQDIIQDMFEECPAIGDNDSGIFVKFFIGQELNRHQYLNRLFDWILDDRRVYDDADAFLCLAFFTTPVQQDNFDIDNIR